MQTQNRKNQNCSIKKSQPKQKGKKHVPVSENSTGMEILQAALKGFKLQLFCVLYFSSTFQVFLNIFIFYLCVGEKWQIILCTPGEQSTEKPRLGYGSLQFRGQPLFVPKAAVWHAASQEHQRGGEGQKSSWKSSERWLGIKWTFATNICLKLCQVRGGILHAQRGVGPACPFILLLLRGVLWHVCFHSICHDICQYVTNALCISALSQHKQLEGWIFQIFSKCLGTA